MAQITYYAPAGVTSINLSDGSLAVVRDGKITADEKFCNELQAAGCTAGQKNAVASEINLFAGTYKKTLLMIGDSLTYGGGGHVPLIDNTPWYGSTTIAFANLGGGLWIVGGQLDGTAPSGASGTLRTDGLGGLQWQYNGDTYGPLVDVRAGGFYVLSSGSSAYRMMVNIRGGTAYPASAGTGSVSTAGFPNYYDWNLFGFSAWLAGFLGDNFTNFPAYAITGATSADLLLLTDQALATYDAIDAVSILVGTNDAPGTAAGAIALANNVKAMIDKASIKAWRVYVGDTFPYPAGTATQAKFINLAMTEVRRYCRTKLNVRFWSAYDRMISPNALGNVAKTGVYHTDNIHLNPFGAYLPAKVLAELILVDFPDLVSRRSVYDEYDATMGYGSLNLNPTLRGAAGTVNGASGITGTAPTSYTLSRSGTTQAVTTAFEAADDGGIDWLTMDVTGATNGDYHELTQTITIPAGVVAGDYIQTSIEIKVFSTTGTGLSNISAQINTNSSIQGDYLLTIGRPVKDFTAEAPILRLKSRPQKLLPGVTTLTQRFRLGAAAAGGGKIGLREYRIEKVTP